MVLCFDECFAVLVSLEQEPHAALLRRMFMLASPQYILGPGLLLKCTKLGGDQADDWLSCDQAQEV